MSLQIGDRIPELLGADQNGNILKFSDIKQPLIIYFYPKDDTSGCTAQACSLRDGYEALHNKGYAVIGVSIDAANSHQKFITKHNLPFRLIADIDKTLVLQFGVWVEKKMYGRSYMGTVRTSYIIDKQGIIIHILSGKTVNTKAHAEQILALINHQ